MPQTGTQGLPALLLQLGLHLVPDFRQSTTSSLWIEIK